MRQEIITTQDFVSAASAKHGARYDYSAVNLKPELPTNQKVTICCPVHGAFEQRPVQHLLGKCCPQCAAA